MQHHPTVFGTVALLSPIDSFGDIMKTNALVGLARRGSSSPLHHQPLSLFPPKKIGVPTSGQSSMSTWQGMAPVAGVLDGTAARRDPGLVGLPFEQNPTKHAFMVGKEWHQYP